MPRSKESLARRVRATKEWRRVHPEKHREYVARYQRAHREQCNASNRASYWRHREERLSRIAEKYPSRKDKIYACNKEWKRLHRAADNRHAKKYRDANPERAREWQQRRRNAMRTAGKLTLAMIRRLKSENINKYGALTCIYCLEPIIGVDTIEHLIPVSRGGTNEYGNLGIACAVCNSKKRNKTADEYRQLRPLVYYQTESSRLENSCPNL